MEQANRGDKSATAAATSGLSVNMYARRPRKKRKKMNNTNPMVNEVSTIFKIENFAAFEFPPPSSFETRTLNKFPKTNATQE